jgi:hypothetical protein
MIKAPLAPVFIALALLLAFVAFVPAEAPAMAPDPNTSYAPMLEGQPPLTPREVQQYIDFSNAQLDGKRAPVPGQGDPARRTYVGTKIMACLQMIRDPSFDREKVAHYYGSYLAVPTDSELALVRSRISDFPYETGPRR